MSQAAMVSTMVSLNETARGYPDPSLLSWCSLATLATNYQGIEFELSGMIGSNIFLNASYCHSSAKGTNPGQVETGSWAQEEGSTNYIGLFGKHFYVPAPPGLEETKRYVDEQFIGLGGRGISEEENNSWYGKLPYSVDHDFKINSFIIAPYIIWPLRQCPPGQGAEVRGGCPPAGRHRRRVPEDSPAGLG